MSPAALYIPFLVLCALVLNILVSTAPIIPWLDITARTHFNDRNGSEVFDNSHGLTSIRFGIWAPCKYDVNGRTCLQNSPGYNVVVTGSRNSRAVISPLLTRALVLHPIAGAASIFALFFTIIPKCQITIVSLVLTFLAGFVTLIAFLIDIVFFAMVQKTMKIFGPEVTTSIAAPGFWMTLASFGLLVLAFCTICVGRRRDQDTAEKNDQLVMEVAGRLMASVKKKK